MKSLTTAFDKEVLASPFAEELKKDVPETYFLLAEFAQKSFCDEIIEELQEENRLQSSYQKLIASAQIPFDGDIYTLSELGVKMECDDRDIRKRATQAYWGWMQSHQDEIDGLYDRMVKVRDRMAKKLGYKNYVELAYMLQCRFDYKQEDVANYRRQVLEDVVPLCNALYERQRERLGYDRLHVYDEKYEFASGNPTPKYDTQEMIARANTMYHELDERCGTFFDFMVEHDLLDLDSKREGRRRLLHRVCRRSLSVYFLVILIRQAMMRRFSLMRQGMPSRCLLPWESDRWSVSGRPMRAVKFTL